MKQIPPLRKVLVANRGEIACRILRTLRRMGIASVAVYSDADSGAAHVRLADEAVRIGPPPVAESYLRGDLLLAAAAARGVDAVHPGYGLLSENAEFAEQCERAGIVFVGPTAAQIRDFGLKHRARELARQAGVPICPGSALLSTAPEATAAAAAIGYPVLLKASAGGGGIGMSLCRDDSELQREYERVRSLAGAHFGNADLFLEKAVERARHVEVQIFGDGKGTVVHLGERDCSLQRRRQKVFEEAPAPGLDPALGERLRAAAVALGTSVHYRSAGTVEFLVDRRAGELYFLEVNTRLQVEHCVTEEIWGVDLVEWMLRLAAGDASPLSAPRPAPRGHSIEVRLYAEDPGRNFQPSVGTLTEVAFAADARIETWVAAGTEVSPFYDPLLAKVVVRADSRVEALQRLDAALAATRIGGIRTNLQYAAAVARDAEFRDDTHHTNSLAELRVAAHEVEVLAPGALSTVQDYPGRLGYWDVGVPPSGPMDWLAFRIGNRILGNADGVAGLELTLNGPTLRFALPALVCLCGAAIDATLDGVAVPAWQPVAVPAGATLRLGKIAAPGSRAYLLVRGGIDVPVYLGSRSTFALGNFGGHGGRPLAAGDVLPLADPDDRDTCPDSPMKPDAAAALRVPYTHDWELRVLDGPHGSPEFFTRDDIDTFYATSFEVHYQSARTGVRLIGPKPSWARADGGDAGLHPSNIHDTAYSVGSVDFTGDMPVILGPDGPSLGGFVCPVVVIQADRWKLGQLTPGDRVRFRAVSFAAARALDRAQERALAARRATPPPFSPAAQSAAAPGDGVVWRRPARGDAPELAIRASGDRHLLVEYGPMVLDITLRIRVQLLLQGLEERRRAGDLPGIIDLTPGIRSLQVHFDPDRLARPRLLDEIESLDAALATTRGLTLPTRTVHLPLSWDDPATREAIAKYMKVVRDDAPWCPSNIEFIRRINGLASHDEVRRIVFDASYLVLGLGDVYLGAPVATPMDPRHRLVTTKYNPARTWTPENAVGIGGAYMCIYGMEGPGGYQFVGRTVPVWNTYRRWKSETPWLLRFFDQIRFHPVAAEELLALRRGVREGTVDIAIEEGRLDVDAYLSFLTSIAAETALFRTRQQAAFAAERRRWQDAGEFEAAEQAEASATSLTAGDADDVPDGIEVVSAPLGAQVWKVLVAPGQRVRRDDELLVLAAMKMESPVAAPCDATVERVAVAEGDVVKVGASLLWLRPDGPTRT